MPKLYYCNTIYLCSCGKNLESPIDVNPLIIRANSKCKFLILCSRQSQTKRIENIIMNSSEWDDIELAYFGWWDAKNMDLVNQKNEVSLKTLYGYNIIIIINKYRIDPIFMPLCNAIELLCSKSDSPEPQPLCA